MALGVRFDTVNSWSSGRRTPPEGVIRQLRDLYARIEQAASQGLAGYADAIAQLGDAPDAIELGLAADDAEAQSIGWPCVGAMAAAFGLIAARAEVPVRIVPRGAALASAAAADIHDR